MTQQQYEKWIEYLKFKWRIIFEKLPTIEERISEGIVMITDTGRSG